jgi:hypothetical protein
MTTYISRITGENFGDGYNKIDNCAFGAWTRFSWAGDDGRVIRFQAVYWNCPSGSLQIRDAYNDIVYSTITLNSMSEPDVLSSFLTIRLPLEYYSSVSGSSIRIFGEFAA